MTIDYRQITKDLLKEYVRVKDSMQDNLERLKRLESNKIKITPAYGDTVFQSSSGAKDDKLLNLMAEIELLKSNIEENKNLIRDVEHSMEKLTDMEKDITITLYGKPYRNNKIQDLENEYSYEKATLYRIANHSLMKMSYVLYGKG